MTIEEWWQKVAADFSDLPDSADAIRMTVRLLFAAFLGGMLGYDRERAGKSAGLRTHMLVSLGAALFVQIPQQAGYSDECFRPSIHICQENCGTAVDRSDLFQEPLAR